jgi:DNA-3-methyladenine glycosylase
MPFPRDFFARPTLEVARDLIGARLVHRAREGTVAGVIVEVEAYIGEDDPACHAAPGPTLRNRPLYGEPGRAYVYLNYGVHYLVNAVTERQGAPAAVLIRALAPSEGLALMRRRRAASRGGSPADHELCRGPGNVSRAFGLTLADNLEDLCGDRLFIEPSGGARVRAGWTARIGIRVGVERIWRCIAVGDPSVSGPRVLNASSRAQPSPPSPASARARRAATRGSVGNSPQRRSTG